MTMARRRLRLGLGGAALALLVGAAPAAAITGGRPDGEAHPNAGIVLLPGVAFCSGALLDASTFVTAGHCTDFFDAIGATGVLVSFDAQVTPSGSFVTASSWQTHPDYDAAAWPQTVDLGVVHLDAPVTLTPVQRPEAGRLEQLVPARGTSRQLYTTVGYGVDDLALGGGAPVPTVSLERRQASNRARTGQGATGGFGLSPFHLSLATQPTERSGGACAGDSGAPVFVGESSEVVAVHAGGPRLGAGGFICARVATLNQRLDLPAVLAWLATV